jgi:hypothetical protein
MNVDPPGATSAREQPLKKHQHQLTEFDLLQLLLGCRFFSTPLLEQYSPSRPGNRKCLDKT